VAGRDTPNPEAQELYLRGWYYWDRRTPEDLEYRLLRAQMQNQLAE
jgi:hypothetical protein